MTKIHFVILFVVCLFSASLTSAGNVTVIFNGKDCGSLKHLSIAASAIIVDSEVCSDLPPPPEPPQEGLIDPACAITPSVCEYFELPFDQSVYYDGLIQPGHRDVYHFIIPEDASLPEKKHFLYFSVVDYGPVVSVNLGISHVKGRVQPAADSGSCFTGPVIQGGLSIATDDNYTKCVKQLGVDYYFTIENTNSNKEGGYRFSLDYTIY